MSTVSIIFCIVLGAASFYGYRKMGEDNKIVKSWSKTPGKILKKDVFDAPRTHDLTVEYEYFVNGTRYQSSNVYRNNPRYSLGYPYDLDKIEFLKNPEVKYDPTNPSDSCLIIYDQTWVFVVSFLAGIILSLFGWGGLLLKIL